MPEARRRPGRPFRYCVVTTIDGTISGFVIPVLYELKGRGVDITMICRMSPAFQARYGGVFRCLNINMSRGADLLMSLKSIVRLYRIFRKEKFDIVQYSTPNAAFYASLASLLAGQKVRLYCQWGLRYVGFENVLVRQIFKFIEKATCLMSTHIRPVSRKNLEVAVQSGLFKRSKAKVLGFGGTIGVDLKEFPAGLKERWRDEMLEAHPALKGRTVFGFVGRIVKDKGVNELLRAYQGIRKTRGDVALLLLGGYDPKGSGVEPGLWDEVRKDPGVIFCGHVPGVPKYMSLMDVLVHPSYREGFGMVLQEAQALALPIITTNIPGPSEVIEPGVTGLLVKPRDARSLQSAMEELLENPEKRRALGAAGPRRVKACFAREWMIGNILSDLESLAPQEESQP